jgi:hypothetical protein
MVGVFAGGFLTSTPSWITERIDVGRPEVQAGSESRSASFVQPFAQLGQPQCRFLIWEMEQITCLRC